MAKMTQMIKFKDYKEKQKYYKDLSKRRNVFYDSGKEVGVFGQTLKKGKPYVKTEVVSDEGGDDK